ncbi:hypothetical protein [Thermocrinis sp.]|uniref:hypothetical protein n=1 Tax=Thermocrinis sp. TaxID=2024383 RepID=UPI002FDCF5D5
MSPIQICKLLSFTNPDIDQSTDSRKTKNILRCCHHNPVCLSETNQSVLQRSLRDSKKTRSPYPSLCDYYYRVNTLDEKLLERIVEEGVEEQKLRWLALFSNVPFIADIRI